MPRPMLRPAAVFLATLVAIALLTRGVVYLAGNDASRFAHIEALVDHHTAAIDESLFAWTVDRAEIGGHLYSNKPPLLGIVGAGLTLPLRALGLSFREETRRSLVWILTLLLAGLPTAWLAAEFDGALLLHRGIRGGTRLLVTAALVLGTTVLTFSVTLSGHTLAGALLFSAFHAAVRGRGAAAGLLCGLAVSIDTVPAIGLAPALLFVAWRGFGRREAGRLVLAFAAAGVVYLAANVATIGSPLPPKVAPGTRDWTGTPGVVERSKSSPMVRAFLPRRLHLAEGLFGWQGFLTTSPILLFGLAGLALGIARAAVFPRSWCAAIGLAVLVQVLGRCSFEALAGGWSYGFRYLVPVIPLVMFFAPAALGGWKTAAFAALLPVSVVLALLGAYNPWPPIRERVPEQDPVIAQVDNPVGANLAAFLEERAPGSEPAAWAARAFLPPDPVARRRYFAYFYAARGDEERCRRYDPEVAASLP